MAEGRRRRGKLAGGGALLRCRGGGGRWKEVDLTRGPGRSVREEEGREKWATGGERPAERTGPLG
jgi:hypothetical protein